jgi:hypothetical protein
MLLPQDLSCVMSSCSWLNTMLKLLISVNAVLAIGGTVLHAAMKGDKWLESCASVPIIPVIEAMTLSGSIV